jgi:surfeit locus 1 family protein
MMRRMIAPILFGVLGCAILMALGIWQVQRMHWKAGVLAQIDTMIVADAVPLMASPDPVTDKYRPVSVDGRFTNEFVEVLSGQKDASPGVRILEAFATADGRRILIDRGFLEDDLRATPRPGKPAQVTGNLHWPIDANEYTPTPDEKTGLWFARDVPAMAAKLGTEPLLIVARAPTGDAITPMPVDSSTIPNDHWGYAITWFLMAVVWAVMTGYLLLRIKRRTV